MNLENFKQQGRLEKLIACRKIAYENGSEIKIELTNNKFWDLFSLYKEQWHYITTLKN